VTFVGKDYVDGDGDKFVFQTSDAVEDGQSIGVEVTNQSDQYAYDYSVDVTLDYAGGTDRTLFSVLGGVF
jgi:hypothetical protein